MKNSRITYLFMLLLVGSFSFTSCEKEDEFIICPAETPQVCEGGDPHSGNHKGTNNHIDTTETGFCGVGMFPIDTSEIIHCGPGILPIDTTKIVYCGPGMLPIDTCQGPADKVLSFTIKNSEVLEYDTQVGGDEQWAEIACQGSVYSVSELIRDSNTNWSTVYRYVPSPNSIGQFSVKIKSFNYDLNTQQTVEQETTLIMINVIE